MQILKYTHPAGVCGVGLADTTKSTSAWLCSMVLCVAVHEKKQEIIVKLWPALEIVLGFSSQLC